MGTTPCRVVPNASDTSPLQCESKNFTPPPEVFWIFFPNGWELLIKILHACYSLILTLNCKMLFNCPQLWQSYAVLSATTQWIFTLLCTVQEWHRLACTVYGLVAVSSCHVQCVLCTVQEWRRLACTVYGLVSWLPILILRNLSQWSMLMAKKLKNRPRFVLSVCKMLDSHWMLMKDVVQCSVK